MRICRYRRPTVCNSCSWSAAPTDHTSCTRPRPLRAAARGYNYSCAMCPAPAAPRQISDQLREIGRGSAAPSLPAGRRAASDLTTIGGRRRAEPFAKRAMKGARLRESQIACDVGHAPSTARELLLGEASQQLVADRTIAVSFPTQAMAQCRCRHAQVPRHAVDVGPVRRRQRTKALANAGGEPRVMRASYKQVGGRSAQKNLEGDLIAPDR